MKERTKEEILTRIMGWETFGAGPVFTDTDQILEAMEEYARKWISVKERLPDVSTTDEWKRESSFSDDVLVWEGGRKWFGYYTPKFGGSWIVPGRMGGIEVTHWQPLPEPPSE